MEATLPSPLASPLFQFKVISGNNNIAAARQGFVSGQRAVSGLSIERQNDATVNRSASTRQSSKTSIFKTSVGAVCPSTRRRPGRGDWRGDGVAPLVLCDLIAGNARGQNPVHLHSFRGGSPARVFRRCPAAVSHRAGGRTRRRLGRSTRGSQAVPRWRL